VDRRRPGLRLHSESAYARQRAGGIIVSVLLGIAGAFVGGFLAITLGISDGVNNFDLGTIVLAVLGAMLLLIVYRSVSGGRLPA
jgi:uncharacterized membrane protein YeaQ/YmgE (transglycosylase-associated protein family)